MHLDSVLYILSFKGSDTFENVLSSLWPFFCSVVNGLNGFKYGL